MTVDREAILREWEQSLEPDWRRRIPDEPDCQDIQAEGWQLLDLGRRYMDAAYKDAARVVEGESLHDNTGDPFDLAYMEGITDAAAAIRALIGGGE